jgi:hypothetical protein
LEVYPIQSVTMSDQDFLNGRKYASGDAARALAGERSAVAAR